MIDFRALAQAFQRIGQVPDPIERLRRVGEAYVEFALAHPMQYQLMFMTLRPPLKDGVLRVDPSEDAYGFLQKICAEAIASGRLRPEYTDPDTLAQICWSTVHGLVSLHIVKARDPHLPWREVRGTARAAIDALARGMSRQP